MLAAARTHGASPAHVRLAWTLRRGPPVLVIPATGPPGHLEDNVAAGALQLTPDEPARLDAVHRTSPER
ncbi:aldo/keto reductase [Amycolatopsis sp. CA-126428]|uniref:aldo/keto reductase n=1 Tax=Amycolatopsis sp. CA-126428 TaxID=2073158 RepID=UPI0035177C6D